MDAGTTDLGSNDLGGGNDMGSGDDMGSENDMGSEDMGTGMMDMGPEDMGPDLGMLPDNFGKFFGACTRDEDCEEPDGICRSPSDGFPMGYCTRPCASPNDRTGCDEVFGDFVVYHHCTDTLDEGSQLTCEFFCANGLDCGRDGYTCIIGALPGGGLCIPVCANDDQCGFGTFCNTYTGRCQDEAPPDPQTAGLSVTGEACAGNGDCASEQCVPAANGWPGGYCISDCILPSGWNSNNLYNGDRLPPGSCAGDAICFPVSLASASRQDRGICYDSCENGADCRDGYTCQRSYQLRQGGPTYTFDNGRCVPAG